jgi:ligand-binding SRPBCC domain-containing protein
MATRRDGDSEADQLWRPLPESALRFEVSSVVAAPAERVWQRIATMAGVNDELAPIFRMTHPRDVDTLGPENVVPGVRLFRSWVLLFGVLPVDYDDLTLVRVTPGVGFQESSTMLSQRRWDHERILEAVPGGCRVTDRIAFVPRVPLLAPIYRRILPAMFRHRHRRLRAAFGDA